MVLATIIQKFRVELVPGHPVVPDPTFTLAAQVRREGASFGPVKETHDPVVVRDMHLDAGDRRLEMGRSVQKNFRSASSIVSTGTLR